MTDIKNTPWGAPQSIDDIGEGVCFVATASHGGYFVPPAINEKIPAAWRAISFNGQGAAGWYEEDCDWCMVALTFPSLFPAKALADARKTFAHWHAEKLFWSAAGLT
jgi:hypothetical protein